MLEREGWAQKDLYAGCLGPTWSLGFKEKLAFESTQR